MRSYEVRISRLWRKFIWFDWQGQGDFEKWRREGDSNPR